jgi:hypothetical protein
MSRMGDDIKGAFPPGFGSLQIWPLGHGSVAMGHNVDEDGSGLLAIAAVPDSLLKEEWQTATPKDLPQWDELAKHGGPASAFVFKDRDSVTRLIQRLEALREEMPT